eukprot:g2748.t1
MLLRISLIVVASILLQGVQMVASSKVCYGANPKLFFWCGGYEQAGYACVGDFCAVEKCVGSCDVCANKYENNVVDPSTGRCCDTIDASGECVNPKSGVPNGPYQAYGYAGGIGALITEGAVHYPNGPPVYPTPISAANGWKGNYPPSDSTADCPPLQKVGYLSKLDSALVKPINLFEGSKGGIPAHVCALSCNISAIGKGEPDPCANGSFVDAKRNIYASMQCFYGGPGFLSDPDLGVCGYNCTIRFPNGTFCPPQERKNRTSPCFEVCDATKF